MQAAAKMSITIPADHRVELKLPDELPAGPAEVIILATLGSAPVDRLSIDETQLDAAAQAAVDQDSRFRNDGELLIFTAALPLGAEDELDHRLDREQRLDALGRSGS
ncbi:MAG: hypothetical protein R3B70_22595 [Polyangiaceae bacterium]